MPRGIIKRTHAKKPWNEMLLKEMEARRNGIVNEDGVASSSVISNSAAYRAKMTIAVKFGKIVREKLRNKGYSCKRTLYNLVLPKKVDGWKEEWGCQLLCVVCNVPAIYECAPCKSCNAIAHRICILRAYRKQLLVESIEDNHLIHSFECENCQESAQAETDYYYKVLDIITADRLKVQAKQMIDQQLKVQLMKQRFMITKRSIITIQSTFRKFRARKVFFMWRRTQLRVLAIEVCDIFPLIIPSMSEMPLPPGILVLTVVDPIRHLQIMRFEKKLGKVMEEAFLIPGVSALMQIVLTFYFVEPNQAIISFTKQINILVGQVVLALRDTANFLSPQTYYHVVSKKVIWIPLEVHDGEKQVIELNTLRSNTDDTSNGYVLCTNTTPNHNSYTVWHVPTQFPIELETSSISRNPSFGPNSIATASRMPSNGSFRLTPTHSSLAVTPTNASQAKLQRPQTATSQRSFSPASRPTSAVPRAKAAWANKSNALTTSSLPSIHRPISPSGAAPFSGDRLSSVHRSRSPVGHSSKASFGNSPIASHAAKHADVKGFLENSYHTCVMKYVPLNPISNMCGKVLGPPIDILRKLPQISRRKDIVIEIPANQKRTTSYWLCISDLWLYFFAGHNDTNVKLISDVREAEVFIDKNPRHSNVLHIHHKDTRKWQFEFEDAYKANKFRFAIQECQDALEIGSSIYFKQPRSGRMKPFGHNCPMR